MESEAGIQWLSGAAISFVNLDYCILSVDVGLNVLALFTYMCVFSLLFNYSYNKVEWL